MVWLNLFIFNLFNDTCVVVTVEFQGGTGNVAEGSDFLLLLGSVNVNRVPYNVTVESYPCDEKPAATRMLNKFVYQSLWSTIFM